MMAQCLKNSLTPTALARLEPYQAQYTFDGVEYGPLMYKIIMRLATIDSVATTETLQKNLDALPSYAATVNGDVDLINSYFDANYSQILAVAHPLTIPSQSCLTVTSPSRTTPFESTS
jgi:hypothetical protein